MPGLREGGSGRLPCTCPEPGPLGPSSIPTPWGSLRTQSAPFGVPAPLWLQAGRFSLFQGDLPTRAKRDTVWSVGWAYPCWGFSLLWVGTELSAAPQSQGSKLGNPGRVLGLTLMSWAWGLTLEASRENTVQPQYSRPPSPLACIDPARVPWGPLRLGRHPA